MKDKIRAEIVASKRILITAHKNPDGDAVGAGLAMYLSLKEMGKDCRFVLQDPIPNTTRFLVGSEEIEIQKKDEVFDQDLVIFLDCANRDRAGSMDAATKHMKTINIDHHMSNNNYGDLALVKAEISATSEILTDLLPAWGFPMNPAIAAALYLGLVNDTGNFSHDNVTRQTMRAAQYLVDEGASPFQIIKHFLKTNSYASLRLLGEALTNFEFYEDASLVYYYLSQDVLQKYQAKKEHTEGIVEKLLSYDQASVSLFLREEADGSMKGSMRSKDDVDVNAIAALFQGGGHKKAAGFSSSKSKDEILATILAHLS